MFYNYSLIFVSVFLFGRFPGGVTYSFTDLAEDQDRLLSFEKMFIGKISLPSNKNMHLLQHDKLQSKDSQLTTL
jgi:hypothetical protein